MEETTDLGRPEDVERRSGYRSVQPERKPSWAGVDLDPARRPGVPWKRDPPQRFPNTRFPPDRQTTEPTVPKHGRPNKPFPPVYGTTCPLHGLSGAVRKLAYRLPDHYPSHWMLMMLGDRVDALESTAKKLAPLALPLGALVLVARFLRR
jgi:hypothetical protein